MMVCGECGHPTSHKPGCAWGGGETDRDRLRAVAAVMGRDLALLYAAGHGESEGLRAYRAYLAEENVA